MSAARAPGGRDAIRITAEPVDGRRCRFVVDRPLYPDRWIYLDEWEKDRGVPLAERLFAIPGVSAVLIAHDTVTIDRPEPSGMPLVGPALRALRRLVGDRSSGSEGWTEIGRAVGAAIREQIESGVPAVPDPPPVAVPSPDELRRRVVQVLEEQVNPVIAGHGGGVTVVDLKDNVLYLQMWGGCQGCGLADLTLKNGVEAALRDAVPEIGRVIDLTDHAAGRNPFRRAGR